MARKKLEERNIRKLAKVGGKRTYSLTLPIEAVRGFGWKEGQKVVVEVDKKRQRFIIKDWPASSAGRKS
ncbi:MAG: hypothetical protein PHZ04_02435 [Patescibacteria group bacterium]|nr:hypothetical protein [Patescibacteria group bacterium]MDD5294683.1 hypothetical protein [Patescibacteria group bacterium]MDD5554455.1 hypothetical protein [Patescibacteria group bacterium]